MLEVPLSSSEAACAAHAATTLAYMRDSTHARHAVQALYRGNGANVARLIPDVAFKFAVHDQFKLMFAPQDGSPPGVQEKMAAGAATGTGARPALMQACMCLAVATASKRQECSCLRCTVCWFGSAQTDAWTQVACVTQFAEFSVSAIAVYILSSLLRVSLLSSTAFWYAQQCVLSLEPLDRCARMFHWDFHYR
jgi:hypothetical protein